jgi:23S rRNA (pseudouridine1915-N3)-methyltransferase
MNLTLAYVAQRSRSDLLEPATAAYLKRIAHYSGIDSTLFQDEEALFSFVAKLRARTPARLVMLDSRGEEWTSETFAKWLGTQRDQGQQNVVFAIGPASGWSQQSLRQGQVLLSLGKITLPHELARLVLAEQIYRAFTILAGHPYHIGH